MDENQLALLAALLEANIDFVVVGGLAVIAHGYVRATEDMDIYLRPSVESAERAFAVFQSRGIPLAGYDAMDLLLDYDNVRFMLADSRVDVLNSIGALHFDEVWSNRVELDVEGLMIPFISKRDLITVKTAVGRHRDLDDVEHLDMLPDRDDS